MPHDKRPDKSRHDRPKRRPLGKRPAKPDAADPAKKPGKPPRRVRADGSVATRGKRTLQTGKAHHKAPAGTPDKPGAPSRRVRADGSIAARGKGIPPRAPATHQPGEPQRIAKLLARAGVGSRRDVERMIADGRIAIDGKVLDTPATIITDLRGVTVDDQPVDTIEPPRLFLFHKPAGLLTAARDPGGRKTIYDRLPPKHYEGTLPRVMPVGRLDLNTEGLLLLTNDGELKRTLELPANGVERSYRARAFGEVSQEQLEGLMMGITIDGMRYGKINANLERRTGRNQWVEMTLTEGKNREVRKVLEHFGLKVSRLIRTRYGPFTLGNSPPGDLVEVPHHDLERFMASLSRNNTNPSPSGEGQGVGNRPKRSISPTAPTPTPPLKGKG